MYYSCEQERNSVHHREKRELYEPLLHRALRSPPRSPPSEWRRSSLATLTSCVRPVRSMHEGDFRARKNCFFSLSFLFCFLFCVEDGNLDDLRCTRTDGGSSSAKLIPERRILERSRSTSEGAISILAAASLVDEPKYEDNKIEIYTSACSGQSTSQFLKLIEAYFE